MRIRIGGCSLKKCQLCNRVWIGDNDDCCINCRLEVENEQKRSKNNSVP